MLPSRDFSSSTVQYRVWSTRVTVHVPWTASDAVPVADHAYVQIPSTTDEQGTFWENTPAVPWVRVFGPPGQLKVVTTRAGSVTVRTIAVGSVATPLTLNVLPRVAISLASL